MTDPDEKEKHSLRRRNFIAKKMRESASMKEKTLDARKGEYKRTRIRTLDYDNEDEDGGLSR